MPLPTSKTVCDLYFIVQFIFHIANCLLCILYRVFLLYPRPTAHFYMHICRILLIQLLGCHIEINACLVFEDIGSVQAGGATTWRHDVDNDIKHTNRHTHVTHCISQTKKYRRKNVTAPPHARRMFPRARLQIDRRSKVGCWVLWKPAAVANTLVAYNFVKSGHVVKPLPNGRPSAMPNDRRTNCVFAGGRSIVPGGSLGGRPATMSVRCHTGNSSHRSTPSATLWCGSIRPFSSVVTVRRACAIKRRRYSRYFSSFYCRRHTRGDRPDHEYVMRHRSVFTLVTVVFLFLSKS